VSEGQQTETGAREAQPRAKVVRLPRDWLGPREDLVPFGPRATPDSPEADVPPASPAGPPTSADDFWGEHSAAVQSALQVPAVHEDAGGGSADTPALRPGGVDRRALAGAAAIRPGRLDRRVLAGAAAVLTIAAALALIAVAGSPFSPGSTPRPVAGSKISFADVLSGGFSSVFRLDLQRVHAARVATATVRRTPHRTPAQPPDHKAAGPRLAPSVHPSTPAVSEPTPATLASSNSYHPTTIDTSDATHAGGTDTSSETPPATKSAPPSSVSRPVASRATVSATGESGALGPIQSPNG
jgi:hypothetical protein